MSAEFGLLALAAWFTRDPGAADRHTAVGTDGTGGEGEAAREPDRLRAGHAGPAATFVGPGVRLVGALRCGHDVVVCGHVEGPVSAEGQVVVEPGGLVEGNITARAVRVRGRTRGTALGAAEIVLERGSEHRGNLSGANLVVEAGAVLEGEVKVGPGFVAEEVPGAGAGPGGVAAAGPP